MKGGGRKEGRQEERVDVKGGAGKVSMRGQKLHFLPSFISFIVILPSSPSFLPSSPSFFTTLIPGTAATATARQSMHAAKNLTIDGMIPPFVFCVFVKINMTVIMGKRALLKTTGEIVIMRAWRIKRRPNGEGGDFQTKNKSIITGQ
jgi:hypothetical protein